MSKNSFTKDRRSSSLAVQSPSHKKTFIEMTDKEVLTENI